MRIREFERLVEEAVADLPDEFRELLDNVAIVVEDEPTAEDYELVDDDEELFGIYRGVPRTERSFDSLPGLPDVIAIFRGPILRECRDSEEAKDEIRDTVIHELGHYFGLDDDELPF